MLESFYSMVLVAGKMYRPTDVAVDIATNSVFVVEQFNHRISKWDYTDTNYDFALDTGWGSNGDGTSGVGAPIGDGGFTDNALYRPTGIAFDVTNSRLYVTDTFHNRVRVINSADGEFVESFGVGGFDTDEFYRPAGIAINSVSGGTPDTVLVIADELNHRAVRYDVNLGSPNNPAVLADPSASSDLSFVRPHGVVYDITENEFNIGDSLRSVISNYTEAGAFINQYGTPGSTNNNVNLFYPGSGNGLLNGGTIFADTRNNILKTLADENITLTTGTSAGVGNGQLYYPESATAFIDAATLYVLAANTLNNRVEIFSGGLTSQDPFNFGKPTP